MPDHRNGTDPTDDIVFDGERFIPGAGIGIAYEHWARYALAAEMVLDRDVLDVGCGEGYGSALLRSRGARSVAAFDASPKAIAHAQRTYPGGGVAFQVATVSSFFGACSGACFDVVVAFEVIEHLPPEEQAILLDGIRRVLRPGGFALISTPDKLLYSDAKQQKNPFHVHEYYRAEYEAELRSRFAHVHLLDQALFTGCALAPQGAKTARTAQMLWNDLPGARATCSPGLDTSGEYLVAMVGDGPIPEPPSLILADFSRKLIAEGLADVRGTADRLARELGEAHHGREAALAEVVRVREDLRRLSAETEQVRRLLSSAPAGRGRRFAHRLVRLVRAVPLRSWIRPGTSARALRSLRRQLGEMRLLENSGLFDRGYYLAEYGDVAASGMDPVEHFVLHGAHEHRNPHALFDTAYYLDRHADVAQGGMNPLVHFLLHGAAERRRPNPLFDVAYYLDRYPDVATSGLNPLFHYLRYGAGEGRDPGPHFSTSGYLAAHPEVVAGGWNPLAHHLRWGARPGSAASRAAANSAQARWRMEVASHPHRALVVDATLLTPDRDSGSVTTLELMKALQGLGYAVTFVPADLRHDDRYAAALHTAGFWCLTERDIVSPREFLEAHGALFDVVVLARVDVAQHLADVVRERCPDAVLVFETMDLHHLRGEREAALTGSEDARRQARTAKAVELDLVRRSDVTLVHSAVELELLAREVPGAALYHLPYVLDARGMGPGFDRRRDIAFIGGFRHRPNVDAVVHFLRDIFPLVRKDVPDVRFLVVGSDPPAELQRMASESVVVTGYVEHLKPILDSCRLTVAPLRFGAGYKGKVAMSLAHGVPAVLSPVAAEGMDLAHGAQVLIAETPADFAKEIVRLYGDRDLWERLAASSLEFAELHFSPRTARAHLRRALQLAGAAPWSPPADDPTPRRATRFQPGLAVFPSRFMRELHRQAGLEFGGTTLVHHGVAFKYPPAATRTDRARLVEPGALQLLVAGRLVNFKGVHTAIEALPRIANALPRLDVRLNLVGDAQDEAYIDRLHRLVTELKLVNRVSFLPPVSEGDLFALFQKHDVYLFTSLFEPFALTLIQALEAGIPTVASATGGNVDLIVDHGTGLLFPAGDAPALAEAVVELASNPLLRGLLSRQGHAAAEKLTAEAMTGAIERCLLDTASAVPAKAESSREASS